MIVSKISDEEFTRITDEIKPYSIMKEEIRTKTRGIDEKKRMVRNWSEGSPCGVFQINDHFKIS